MPEESAAPSVRLVLFDDARARDWSPLADCRPVGELLFGCATLRERAEQALGLRCEAYVAEGLEELDEPDLPPVRAPGALDASACRLFLSTRCVLRGPLPPLPEGPARLVVDDRTVGWLVPAGASPPPLDEPGRAEGGGPPLVLEGTVLEHPWDLVRANPDAVREDVAALFEATPPPPGVHVIGEGTLSLAPDAVIEPGVTLDLRDGPVRIGPGARIEGPARLVGPLFVGAGTLVFGGHLAASSIGPVCKVRGEVADSVLVGWANKAHDGYLGHALVGRWVNLGALTTNSDLKNNYGSVSVRTARGRVDTGLAKVGCFLGDHVKTGIGTLINTGTVIGTGSNVFGGAMPPTFVPAFSWGSGQDLVDYRLDRFFEVAERAMARRGAALGPGARAILERLWHHTAPLRADGPAGEAGG